MSGFVVTDGKPTGLSADARPWTIGILSGAAAGNGNHNCNNNSYIGDHAQPVLSATSNSSNNNGAASGIGALLHSNPMLFSNNNGDGENSGGSAAAGAMDFLNSSLFSGLGGGTAGAFGPLGSNNAALNRVLSSGTLPAADMINAAPGSPITPMPPPPSLTSTAAASMSGIPVNVGGGPATATATTIITPTTASPPSSGMGFRSLNGPSSMVGAGNGSNSNNNSNNHNSIANVTGSGLLRGGKTHLQPHFQQAAAQPPHSMLTHHHHHHHQHQHQHHSAFPHVNLRSGLPTLSNGAFASGGSGMGAALGSNNNNNKVMMSNQPPHPMAWGSGLHHHQHHHHHSNHVQHLTQQQQLQQAHHRASVADLSQHLRNIDTFEENQSGVALVSYAELAKQPVDDLGRCNIIDIRSELWRERVTYYSEHQNSNIVTGTAVMPNGTRHRVQRVMVGQLWMDFVKNQGLEGHAVGKLLSYIANEPITIFGMIPQDALKVNASRSAVPAMVGFWLSIDPQDHPDSLVDLQRATVIFARRGLLCAFNKEEHRRLLEIAENRRAQGSTGLPESPMTLEAAKNPPKRSGGERDVEVFRYRPPRNHPYPITRGGFRPFVTRWESTLRDENDNVVVIPDSKKGFALLARDMNTLEPWERRVFYRWKPVPRSEEDDQVQLQATAKDPTWC